MGKRFYNIDMRGKFLMERLATTPAWQSGDEGRIIYAEDTEDMKFGQSADWSNAGAYNDVPLNTILLIESDTALTGYTLLTNKDDMSVYVTKGSGAGGEAAGTDKSGGTWTQPNHTHTGGAHTHTGPSHTHTGPSHTHTVASGTVPGAGVHTHPPQAGFGNFMSTTGSSVGNSGDSYGAFNNTGNNVAGSTSHDHGGATGSEGSGATGADGTGATGSGGGGVSSGGATANTWRPTGRNFTRQQRA